MKHLAAGRLALFTAAPLAMFAAPVMGQTPSNTAQAAPAAAQNAQEADAALNATPNPTDDTAGTGIAEADIIVTAQRRSESLQRTALSIGVVQGDELQRRSAATLGDALKTVPSVTIDRGPKGFLPRIRGEGLNIPPSVGDPSVAISRDGVFDSSLGPTFGGMFDVARVEAVRGPQGTLYGRNAVGGAINIITNDPSFETEARASVTAGNHHALRLQGMGNTQLSDTLAVRAAFSTDYHKGYLSNGQDGVDNKVGRVKLMFKPSDAFSLTASGEIGNFQGVPGGSAVAFGLDQPDHPWTSGTTRSDSYLRGRSQKYYLAAEGDLGFANYIILPAYQKYTELSRYYFAVPQTDQGQIQDVTQIQESVEARLSSPSSSPIKWVFGLFYFKADNSNIGNNIITLPVRFEETIAASYFDEQRQVTSKAVFGQATIPVIDSFRLTVGGRQTWDTRKLDRQTLNLRSSGLEFADVKLKFKHFDYKAGFEFDVTDASMLYGHVSTAYASGGWNYFRGTSFAPEEVMAYEVGMKNRFFDNILTLNASGFYYNYKNYQVNSSPPNPFATSPSTLLDVTTADARTYGAEVETVINITPADRLNASISYLDAKFTQFARTDLRIYNGRPFLQAPKWSVVAGYSHTFDLANGGDLVVQANTRWRTRYYLTFNNLPPTVSADARVEPEAHISDASITYSAPGHKWQLTAGVQNIENHATKTAVIPGPPSGYVVLGSPRTYSATLSMNF